jgi:hypothetical protein
VVLTPHVAIPAVNFSYSRKEICVGWMGHRIFHDVLSNELFRVQCYDRKAPYDEVERIRKEAIMAYVKIRNRDSYV